VALVDFTPDNGATRVVPGSHRTWSLTVPREPDIAVADERIITCPAGSAIVFAESLVHSGTRNTSVTTRASLQVTWNRVPG
jgi:ectoine hydroxylase-related dioxygenase (phytanoyl-CoA dioxygenase family)